MAIVGVDPTSSVDLTCTGCGIRCETDLPYEDHGDGEIEYDLEHCGWIVSKPSVVYGAKGVCPICQKRS